MPFIKSLVKDANLREDFNAGMREKIVTGQPMYLVDYNEKTGKVDFHVQSAMRGFYSRSSSNRWTDEGDWCCTLEYMSISQIMAEFDLEEDEYKQLNSYVTGDTSALYSYNYNIAVFNPADSEERQHGWYSCLACMVGFSLVNGGGNVHLLNTERAHTIIM